MTKYIATFSNGSRMHRHSLRPYSHAYLVKANDKLGQSIGGFAKSEKLAIRAARSQCHWSTATYEVVSVAIE